MYIIKRHTHTLVCHPDGWAILCDGVALWAGLTKLAADNLMIKLEG